MNRYFINFINFTGMGSIFMWGVLITRISYNNVVPTDLFGAILFIIGMTCAGWLCLKRNNIENEEEEQQEGRGQV